MVVSHNMFMKVLSICNILVTVIKLYKKQTIYYYSGIPIFQTLNFSNLPIIQSKFFAPLAQSYEKFTLNFSNQFLFFWVVWKIGTPLEMHNTTMWLTMLQNTTVLKSIDVMYKISDRSMKYKNSKGGWVERWHNYCKQKHL